MWLYTLISCTWTLVLANVPAHLRPGALSSRLGTVHLVEDVLWVRFPHVPLRSVPRRLRQLVDDLDNLMQDLERSVPQDSLYRQDSMRLFHARAKYVNETVALTLANFADLDAPARRSKRGLLDLFGRISKSVFGTAMDSDVQLLKTQYAQLTQAAQKNNRLITLTNRHVQILTSQVEDMADYCNTLRDYLIKHANQAHTVFLFHLAHQALSALEAATSSFLRSNQVLIQNLVDAAARRVTPDLFPFRDLKSIIRLAQKKYSLTPLFSRRELQFYYPVLDAFATESETVVLIPFKSLHSLEAYTLRPFPFTTNGSVLTLDLPESVVLTSTDLSQYAVVPPSDLDKCHTVGEQILFCAASTFAFFPLTTGVCEVALTKLNSSEALQLCPYRHLVPRPVYHVLFSGFHYFLFVEPTLVSIVCPEKTKYVTAEGHLALHIACYVHSTVLKTYPEKLHEGFVSSNALPLYPLDGLRDLNLSFVQYTTNTLQPFTFSNMSTLQEAISDTLPVYMDPAVHYPAFLVPLLICLATVLILALYVRKSLGLSTYLQGLLKKREPAPADPDA